MRMYGDELDPNLEIMIDEIGRDRFFQTLRARVWPSDGPVPNYVVQEVAWQMKPNPTSHQG